MIIIPPLKSYTHPRPGRPNYEEPCLVPDEQYEDFWETAYQFLRAVKLNSPVVRNIRSYVNPLFGFYGFRVHPVTRESRYFHVGLSLDVQKNRKIYPIRKGILEYAGYGAVNGYYILLSHPDIVTEDGYVLHSMYCHLRKPLVKFTSYQKMLREISLGSYPLIEVPKEMILGTASTSGLARENHPGLYLQLSFRKYNEISIIIDPLRVYQHKKGVNTTENMVDADEIENLMSEK